MPVGPGGHGGSEDRRIPPSGGAGGRPHPGQRHRRRERSPLQTLRGTGRVIPFQRPRQPGAPEELAPRQSRVLVAALATLLAGTLIFTTIMLRPRAAPPAAEIVLPVAQFRTGQPALVQFANYPHVVPAIGTGMYVVRLSSGWLAFANLPPGLAPRAKATHCTLTWAAQTSRFQDPCTGATWRIDGVPAGGAAPGQADLSAFAVTEQGGFIDVNVGSVAQ